VEGEHVGAVPLALMDTVATALLGAEGDLDPGLRRAALQHAAGAAGDSTAGREPLPEPLASFVDNVARRAHQVGDADIESLRRAGFSDDAILEAVLAAAVGAGLSRLRIGMAALSGRR
jgi:hypothetical protein